MGRISQPRLEKLLKQDRVRYDAMFRNIRRVRQLPQQGVTLTKKQLIGCYKPVKRQRRLAVPSIPVVDIQGRAIELRNNLPIRRKIRKRFVLSKDDRKYEGQPLPEEYRRIKPIRQR